MQCGMPRLPNNRDNYHRLYPGYVTQVQLQPIFKLTVLPL